MTSPNQGVWVALAIDPQDHDILWIAASRGEAGALSALQRKMRATYTSLTNAGSDGDYTEWAEQFEVIAPELIELE